MLLPTDQRRTETKKKPPRGEDSHETFVEGLYDSRRDTLSSDTDDVDVDRARRESKFSSWLQGPDADLAAAAAKRINRPLYLLRLTGNTRDGSTSTLACQLYVLTKALASLRRKDARDTRPGAFLDAGCGGGYLLLAWCQATGGRALGVDSDPQTLAIAERIINEDDMVAGGGCTTPRPNIELLQGDALTLEPALTEPLDAINVGLAVDSPTDLAPLARLLRVGGALTAPVAQGSASGPCHQRRACFLQTLVKASDGRLVREPDDQDIPCVFFPGRVGP
jgi:SAM-dependent methyltransferase